MFSRLHPRALGPGRLGALAIALLLVGFTTFVNAWCGDDPYITFRAVDNAVNGYGLTWNPGERVQVFTHPLWALFMTGAYFVTREVYFTALFASLAFSIAVVFIMHATTRDRPWWTTPLAAILLVGSKAYIDYSTSGLENCLTHVFVVLSFASFVFAEPALLRTERGMTLLFLTATLVYLNRADAVLTVAPALAWASWSARSLRWRLVRAAAIGTLPAAAWTAFSLVYYGFPFPNTAYAKLNGGRMASWFHPNGVIYFANSLKMDPLTLPLIAATIAVGTWMALRRRAERVVLLPVAGAAAYLVYAMRIGGDYMSGRLFALPLLLAVVVVIRLVRDWRVAAGVAATAVVLALCGPRPPITSGGAYPTIPIDPTGIRDERGNYYQWTGLELMLKSKERVPGRPVYPDDQIRNDPPLAMVWGAIGYYGFVHGPRVQTIDPLALGDALLARLPSRDELTRGWGRGHLFRDVPAGTIESVEMAENRIADPELHDYVDQLQLVIAGPLWSAERFRAIWALNTGKYKALLEHYATRSGGAGS
jgi:arabinofuranosyltransferase